MTSPRGTLRKPALPQAVVQHAFPYDPDLPQLAIATDPGLMLELFRIHLKPVMGKHSEIAECVPFRFRCRQSGTRCVLQYTLRLVEPGTDRHWDQWVTGSLYTQPGEAERLWREAYASDPRRAIPEPWLTFEPVDFIPELQMLVQVFPFDRKLRHLSPLLGGAARDLERLLLERLANGGKPEQWEITDRVLEPARYRTELGAALKLTVHARETATTRRAAPACYLKVYRNERGQGTFQFLQACAERAPTEFGVVRPLAYLSEWRTLALEEVAGTTLQQLLLNDSDPLPAARSVARAVAAFNQDGLGTAASRLAHHPLAAQLQDVERAASLLQWACPNLHDAVQEITAALTAGLEETLASPIHRDLKPDHIFVSDDRVIFIDVDSVALGDAARDPAHLFAHMVSGAGLDGMPSARRHAAAYAFVEEYFTRVPNRWRHRHALHCAGALLEVAGGIFKHQEPRWRDKVTAAVQEARSCLRRSSHSLVH